jgi:hypothetical protein
MHEAPEKEKTGDQRKRQKIRTVGILFHGSSLLIFHIME